MESVMTGSYEDILFTCDEGIATITLNRPERLNAWTATMERSLNRAVHAAAGDEAVRAIVVTGAGRGFCSGADMQLLQDPSLADGMRNAPQAKRSAAHASTLD